MDWIRCQLTTTAEAEDYVTAALSAIGIDSVEISDNILPSPDESGGLFGDVLPDLPTGDRSAVITYYLTEEEDPRSVHARFLKEVGAYREFTDLGELSLSTETVREEDWINNWKQYFHAFTVDGIRIVPSWEEADEDTSALTLTIDPGIAFGTGKHESTQLAIRGIRTYLQNGDRVLDVGTGSGILGILALKSGASYVAATDIDDNVKEALAENLKKNQIDPASFRLFFGDLITEPHLRDEVGPDYDLVCANIIAEILIELIPVIPCHLKSGGLFLLSGILTDRKEKVKDALEQHGFTVEEEKILGEWCGLAARLLAASPIEG